MVEGKCGVGIQQIMVIPVYDGSEWQLPVSFGSSLHLAGHPLMWPRAEQGETKKQLSHKWNDWLGSKRTSRGENDLVEWSKIVEFKLTHRNNFFSWTYFFFNPFSQLVSHLLSVWLSSLSAVIENGLKRTPNYFLFLSPVCDEIGGSGDGKDVALEIERNSERQSWPLRAEALFVRQRPTGIHLECDVAN